MMCSFMIKYILILFFASSLSVASAQSTDALYKTARTFMMKGEPDSAITYYNALLKVDPDNIDALNDYCYLLIIEKKYDKAISLGKELVAKPKAIEQSYQTLGMAYKSNNSFAEAETLYKQGLKKFPESGVLYNEYGELFAMQNKLSDAIIQWEAGIKADPNYSNNYYNATMYYCKVKIDLFWAIQYGEIFLNLESYTAHSALIKVKLFDAYKKIFTGDALDKLAINPNLNEFQKAWFTNVALASCVTKGGIDADILGALRTRFILNWFNAKQNEKTPFHLFDQQQYLLKNGLFDAYNQWIFGEAANPQYYQMWANTHARELNLYQSFQQSKLYKQPSGEYYK